MSLETGMVRLLLPNLPHWTAALHSTLRIYFARRNREPEHWNSGKAVVQQPLSLMRGTGAHAE